MTEQLQLFDEPMTRQLRLFPELDNIHTLDPAILGKLAARFDYRLPDDLADISDFRTAPVVFAELDNQAPAGFVRALNMIAELDAGDAVDALIGTAPKNDLDQVGDALPPVDFAAELWLRNPQVVEQVYAERVTRKVRSFEYYQTPSGSKVQPKISAGDDLGPFVAMLKAAFSQHKRGEGVRVVAFQRGTVNWFQVLHGDVVKHDQSWENEVIGDVWYRPLRYDMVGYDANHGELRISQCTPWQKDLYRKAFGRFLFGDEEFFPGIAKFTLEPLRDDARAVLNCVDIRGLERVTLLFLEVLVNEVEDYRQTHGSRNLLRCGFPSFPLGSRIIEALFELKLRGLRKPRKLRICPSNVAIYKHDSYGECIEEWMFARGLAREVSAHENDEIETVLAIA